MKLTRSLRTPSSRSMTGFTRARPWKLWVGVLTTPMSNPNGSHESSDQTPSAGCVRGYVSRGSAGLVGDAGDPRLAGDRRCSDVEPRSLTYVAEGCGGELVSGSP